MRNILLFIFLFAGIHSYGQKITGTVIDKFSKLPIKGALVNSSLSKANTNSKGEFTILVSRVNDTLKIFHEGYDIYIFSVVDIKENNLHIELKPKSILLKEVIISSARDHRKDSLRNRKEYEKEFSYRPPNIKDVLESTPIGALKILFNSLNGKKRSSLNLKNSMIENEHNQFIDRKFNSTIVSKITGLKGDSLNKFLTQFRPSYEFVLKTPEYDMMVYIKNCYRRFIV